MMTGASENGRAQGTAAADPCFSGLNVRVAQAAHGRGQLLEPERAGGGDRNIDDAAAKERPSAGDYDAHDEAIVQIDHAHSRSDRQTAMRRNQSAARRTIVGC